MSRCVTHRQMTGRRCPENTKHQFTLSLCLVNWLAFLKSTFQTLVRSQLGGSQRARSQMYSRPPPDRVTFAYAASHSSQRWCARRDTAVPVLYDFFIPKLSRPYNTQIGAINVFAADGVKDSGCVKTVIKYVIFQTFFKTLARYSSESSQTAD